MSNEKVFVTCDGAFQQLLASVLDQAILNYPEEAEGNFKELPPFLKNYTGYDEVFAFNIRMCANPSIGGMRNGDLHVGLNTPVGGTGGNIKMRDFLGLKGMNNDGSLSKLVRAVYKKCDYFEFCGMYSRKDGFVAGKWPHDKHVENYVKKNGVARIRVDAGSVLARELS